MKSIYELKWNLQTYELINILLKDTKWSRNKDIITKHVNKLINTTKMEIKRLNEPQK